MPKEIGHPDGDRGVEAAEQDSGDQRIDQEIRAHARLAQSRLMVSDDTEPERRAVRHAGGIVHPPKDWPAP
jgi:hypothetical protein